MSTPKILDLNEMYKYVYLEKIARPGFCLDGPRPTVFTRNETMICGLKNIDMAEDCLEYERSHFGDFVNGTLILPCEHSAGYSRIVTNFVPEVESGSNYKSPNFIIRLQYKEKIVQPGFCIGNGATVFTKNETMICGLRYIDLEEDCLEYKFISPGYSVIGAFILPCEHIVSQYLIVMAPPESGSNYQSPNFNILFISMMLLFIFYFKR
ncbi:hypothetical protein EDC94DRAFT_664371 [Helicostylum pulchrum]|nr:hypothetical protein EDC94DRAFT_664371 [Helicostylum pulchrum]